MTNYKKPYYITCASVNKKRTGPSHNKVNKFLKSSLNYFSLYPLVNVIVKSLYFVENPANLVKLCFPDPPYPTSRACPKGNLIILYILTKCYKASSNKTKFI